MEIYPDHIPTEIQALDSFLFWKNTSTEDGKMTKSSVSSAGFGIAHNDTDKHMPFELAKEKLSEASGLGLGISLLEGLKVNVETHTGYLWCLDFDGFAEPNSEKVDDGVTEFIDAFPSYIEISPSGTGFKYFFVCDRPPQSKSKIKFGPSEFAEKYPNITKYARREIEVFSRSFYLALTGQVFSPSTAKIKFVSSTELENLLEHLNSWAKSTGGSGTTASSNAGQTSISTTPNTSYSKLTKPSLEVVLACVDHVDEQVWTNTANALARVYGEDGRSYFQKYSKGGYAGTPYAGYNSDECHKRFDRALNELKGKPGGFGVRHLIEIASNHPDWNNEKVKFEEVNPFESSAPELPVAKLESLDSPTILLEKPHSEVPSGSLLDRVKSFSITGQSTELKRKALSDKFIMDRIAILGQWTAIYAAPGTGKTLLTLWMLTDQLSNGLIQGNQVFYVNADDNYKGMTEKLEIAEKCGLEVLVPNFNGFNVDQILPIMKALAKSDQARGIIFVLDTLKKFTDLMDKRISSHFGNTAREFIAAGGSLIVLAHTNKHKDVEGKAIYSGTSDIVDDADCAFIINKVDECEEFTGKKITVEFSNIKARGDVASTLGFTYSKGGQSYSDLLDSVIRIDQESLKVSKLQLEAEKQLASDLGIIEAACLAIKAGINTKDALIKEIKRTTSESTASARRIVEARTGNDYAQGHRWAVRAGDHNAKIFSVLPTL
ncbi:hypothetical protein N9558_03275 [Porticoccaceae bacterium]|nr:hypothetical protein [Porticoccaceae bacterium]